MADTLEFSEVAFRASASTDELIAELRAVRPSQLEIPTETATARPRSSSAHLYIERRMLPLNLPAGGAWTPAGDAPPAPSWSTRHRIRQRHQDLVAANIFPGDMLWKNFGVTRHGKVVFYDYDEIEYITDCNFRRAPPPRNEEDERSGEVWYSVRKNDVPETFGPSRWAKRRACAVPAHHADLLTPEFWQEHQARIRRGEAHPYGAQYVQWRRWRPELDRRVARHGRPPVMPDALAPDGQNLSARAPCSPI